MATAMVSALTGIPVRKDLAMTGEITLRGRVLPIGGLKSKILAAHLAGAKMVMLPQKNEKDLRDIPEEIRKQMKLVLVDSMEQVLATALRRKPAPLKAPPPEVIERGEPLSDTPSAPDKLRRGFPGPEQPTAVAKAAEAS
jgi:ATP-dependent Lon protease